MGRVSSRQTCSSWRSMPRTAEGEDREPSPARSIAPCRRPVPSWPPRTGDSRDRLRLRVSDRGQQQRAMIEMPASQSSIPSGCSIEIQTSSRTTRKGRGCRLTLTCRCSTRHCHALEAVEPLWQPSRRAAVLRRARPWGKMIVAPSRGLDQEGTVISAMVRLADDAQCQRHASRIASAGGQQVKMSSERARRRWR